jgi:hypothetical protein
MSEGICCRFGMDKRGFGMDKRGFALNETEYRIHSYCRRLLRLWRNVFHVYSKHEDTLENLFEKIGFAIFREQNKIIGKIINKSLISA